MPEPAESWTPGIRRKTGGCLCEWFISAGKTLARGHFASFSRHVVAPKSVLTRNLSPWRLSLQPSSWQGTVRAAGSKTGTFWHPAVDAIHHAHGNEHGGDEDEPEPIEVLQPAVATLGHDQAC
jgi:hypothetical protein